MAIFSKKETKKTEKKTAPKKASSTKTVKKDIKTTSADLSWVLVKPRITERSALLAEKKVYVFTVSNRANKKQIAEAIKIKFGVIPTKVNVVVSKPKTVIRRGRFATTSQFKKAYVYLKPADTIEFV